MQLFGLVNTLLQKDPETFKRHLTIVKYPVIPLSPNSGLLGWVQSTDTLHVLIKNYRDSRKILLNIEHRLILQVSRSLLFLSSLLCSAFSFLLCRWHPILNTSVSCRSSRCSNTRSIIRLDKISIEFCGSRVEIRRLGSIEEATTAERLQSCQWLDTFSDSAIVTRRTCSWIESAEELFTSISEIVSKLRCSER